MGKTEQPPRPSISSVFIFALALWIGSAVILSITRMQNVPVGLIVIVDATATVGAGVYFAKTKGVNAIGVLVLGASLGILLGCASSFALTLTSENILDQGITHGTIELNEDAKKSSFGSSATGKLLLENGRSIRVGLYIPNTCDDLPRFGDVIDSSFEVVDPNFNSSTRWWNKGCVACLNIKTYDKTSPNRSDSFLPTGAILSIRNNAITSFSSLYEGETPTKTNPLLAQKAANEPFSNYELSQMLSALACGYKSNLSDCLLYGAFKKCGLAHMMAVSGAHLVIVVSLFNVLSRALSLSRKAMVVLDVSVMLGYLLLSGFPVSALRATLMTATTITSSFSKRRPSSINALGMCAVVIIISDPFASLSVSFLLSFASTVGIVIFSPYITHLLKGAFNIVPDALLEAISLTASSNIVCLPISCALFSQLPLITLVANAICGLIFPFLCAIAVVCGLSFTVTPFASGILLAGTSILGRIFCMVVCALADLPFSCIPIYVPEPIGYALTIVIPTVFWIAWPQANKRTAITSVSLLAVLFCALLAAGTSTTDTKITMLDVGQGDAFLVQSNSKTLLIDTGNHDSMLLEALGRNHVCKIDGVLITHADNDHAGSLKALSNSITIDSVFIAEGALKCNDASCKSLLQTSFDITDNVITLTPGDIIEVGSFSLEDVWPYEIGSEWGNANSICMYATADVNEDGQIDCKALFCGDAEIEQMDSIIVENGISDIDILKVAHHGSKTGTNEAIAEELKPKIALISVGENRYGHPSQSVVDCLVGEQANVFRSDISGDVSCKISAGFINVITQR